MKIASTAGVKAYAAASASQRAFFSSRRFDAGKLAGMRRYSQAVTAEGRLYLGDGSPPSDVFKRVNGTGEAFDG